MKNTCIVCGNTCRRSGSKFCSRKCYAEYRQTYAVCPICGIKFKHSPSDTTTHTCGNQKCMAKWRSLAQSGKQMCEANQAIKKLPHTGHFETHHNAEKWILSSPEKKLYHFKNLHLWVENNSDLLPVSARTGKKVDIRTFEREIIRLKHALKTDANNVIRNNYYGWKVLDTEESS